MTDHPVRYGIVGLNHGKQHVGVVDAQPNAELAAVCDSESARLDPYRQRDVRCYDDFGAMLDDDAVDAVVIATPAQTHVAMTEQALAAGKHVLLEKPVASTLAELLRLQEAERAHPALKVQVGFEFRSSPLVQEVKRVIDSGRLGRVHQVVWTSYRPKFYPPEQRWKTKRDAGGGPLFDESSHFNDIMNYWVDSRFTRASAFGGIDYFDDPEREVEDNAVVLYEYEDHTRAMSGFADFVDQPTRTLTELVGSNGRMRIDYDDGGGYVMHAGDGQHRTTFRINPARTCGGHLGFGEQHANFIRSIRDDTPVIAPIEAGVETQLMGLAALWSIQQQRVISRDEVIEQSHAAT